MLIRNELPFAAMGFGQIHRDGGPMAVLCARSSYTLFSDGTLRLADAQELVLNDVYEGDPQRTPLLRVGDLVPYKPSADVTVIGTAHAPGGRPAAGWTVSVAVGDHRAALRVHGPRDWDAVLNFVTPTWKLGAAKPVASVPLDWRLAAGGRVVGHPDGEADRENPIGPGVLDQDLTRRGRPFRAPQIDAAAAPVALPFARVEPRGFGPVAPFWRWRQRHAGTYDETWRRAPERRLPVDFEYRFYQTAPPWLILPRLRGDEAVRLEGLVPGGGALAFALPGMALVAHHAWSDRRRVAARLSLDGLHIDLREEPWRVDLTWRGWIAACPSYDGAVLAAAGLGEAEGLPVSGERGLEEAGPAA